MLKRRDAASIRHHYVLLAVANPQRFGECRFAAVALEDMLGFQPVIQPAALLHHGPPQPGLKPLFPSLAHRLPPLFFASVRCSR